jgi:hypothetical protein
MVMGYVIQVNKNNPNGSFSPNPTIASSNTFKSLRKNKTAGVLKSNHCGLLYVQTALHNIAHKSKP